MSARHSASWQTALADLSLILFMVTAFAVSREAGGADDNPAREASAWGEASAIWSEEAGSPPFARWLVEARGDSRQRLTVTARYAPGQRDAAIIAAHRLVDAAGDAGRGARIVVEPGAGPVEAVLTYDRPDLARD